MKARKNGRGILLRIRIAAALLLCLVLAAGSAGAGKVTFDANNGSGVADELEYKKNEPTFAGDCPTVFSHWNTKPDGTGVDIYPLDEIDHSKYKTLYAQYIERPTVRCTVAKATKKGDLLLDVTKEQLKSAFILPGDLVRIRSGVYNETIPFYTGRYTEEAMLCAKANEDAATLLIKNGDFSAKSGISAGDEVTIELVERAGAKAMQVYHNLNMIAGRSNSTTDEAYGNFREITFGNIARKKLYRSAHPLSQDKRGTTIQKLMKKAGIRTVMNMANTEEEVDEMIAERNLGKTWYAKIRNEGNVFAEKLNWSYLSADFAGEFVRGLTFLAEHDPPYLFHCNVGRDRTGFAAMVFGMLTEADREEILQDYMQTYANDYHLHEGMEVWDLVLHLRAEKMMDQLINQYGDGTDPGAAARNYLLSNGMDPEKLDLLVQKLTDGSAKSKANDA